MALALAGHIMKDEAYSKYKIGRITFYEGVLGIIRLYRTEQLFTAKVVS
ncbi:hypothetical protein ACFQU5_00670 [Ureibacillus sp. GCM10028918]